MNDFGLVTEGITDQVVIRNILHGYFNDPNLVITAHQPLQDETDKARSSNIGGWGNLRDYCQSETFRQTFQITKYVVIQLDTDLCDEYGVSSRGTDGELRPQELISKVIAKVIEWIGLEFYGIVKDRIIFAISVHAIECWFLPIYYSDKKREKVVGCLGTLNQALNRSEGFSIDPNNKVFAYYRDLAKKNFSKRKELDKYYLHNPSFRVFVEGLAECTL